MFDPGVDKFEGVLVRHHKLGACSLDKWAPYLKRGSGKGECKSGRASGEVDVLLMLRVADLVERIDQGILEVRFECNVEVDGGADRRRANTLPVCWDGVPCVLNANVTPKWCRKRREVYEGYFEKDSEHKEPVVAHYRIIGSLSDEQLSG